MVLVTGSTGLVGSHLLFSLLKQGKEVKALIRNEASKKKIEKVFAYYCAQPEDLMEKVNWILADVRDQTALDNYFVGVKQVYHCAATVSFDNKYRQEMLDVNIKGTATIVNLCLQHTIEKLVHVSSIAAIGKPKFGKKRVENCEWPQGKQTTYSYTKTQSELEVWRAIAEGLNAVIVNPSVIFGPGNWTVGSGRIFNQVYKGMKYYTKGVTGFVDVRDVVKVMLLLMKSDLTAERYILNSENLSYKNVMQMVAKYLGVKAPRLYANSFLTSIAWRMDKLKSWFTFSSPIMTKQSAKTAHKIQEYSAQKIKDELGFEFMSIEKSIQETAEKFKVS